MACWSFWGCVRWKSLNKNDRDQVLWARETEYPTQTLVFTDTAGRPTLLRSLLLRSSVRETGSSQCCLELHHGTVWGWIFRTTFQQLSAQRRELKQWRQRRPRKRRCQNEFASHQTLSRLCGTAQFAKSRRFFLELNSSGLYPGIRKERKIRRRMFTSCLKRRIMKFHVVVVLWTTKKCTKSAMHV